ALPSFTGASSSFTGVSSSVTSASSWFIGVSPFFECSSSSFTSASSTFTANKCAAIGAIYCQADNQCYTPIIQYTHLYSAKEICSELGTNGLVGELPNLQEINNEQTLACKYLSFLIQKHM
ncbi:hypothetical protein Anas_05705, partial [Armadillidium nasatum]